MAKAIKVKERDIETMNELVDDPHDEMTFAEKFNEIVDKAYAWETRGSDVL